MKLFEALALKKALQAQLAQLIDLRNNSYEYPEDEKKAEFDFNDLTTQIKEKVNEITSLKLAIMKVNMDTTLSNKMTLYASIIEMANIRAAMEQLRGLLSSGRHGFMAMERRRTTQEIKVVKQLAPSELLKMIDKYDGRRRVLDALIQEANHTLEIPWKEKQ